MLSYAQCHSRGNTVKKANQGTSTANKIYVGWYADTLIQEHNASIDIFFSYIAQKLNSLNELKGTLKR